MTRMHARKTTKSRGKGKGGSSGGANPRNDRSDRAIREEQHDEAVRILRAEYYQGVRGIAQELDSAVKNGEIRSQDDWESRIHQAVDGSYWVIYTHANFQVLMCSDNHDAYVEDFGEPPLSGNDINWAALAFAAFDRDVREQLEAEGLEPDWDNLTEAPRRGRVNERRGPRGLRRRP